MHKSLRTHIRVDQQMFSEIVELQFYYKHNNFSETVRFLLKEALREQRKRKILGPRSTIPLATRAPAPVNAVTFLADILSNDLVNLKDIKRQAKEGGFCMRSIRRASRVLKVVRESKGASKTSWWRLPSENALHQSDSD